MWATGYRMGKGHVSSKNKKLNKYLELSNPSPSVENTRNVAEIQMLPQQEKP